MMEAVNRTSVQKSACVYCCSPVGGALCQFGWSSAQLRAPPAHQQGPCGAVCAGAALSGRGAAGGGGGRRAGAGGGSGLDPRAAGSDGSR